MSAPDTWPPGTGRVVLAETDSTLDEARRRFADLASPLWILALHQSAARGRRGRAWVHPAGNFAANHVAPMQADPRLLALRSFTTSLALHDALVALTGRAEPFALKWPNDVLLNGGKLAGILLETMSRGNRAAGLSIGIGVNLAQAPGAEAVEARALRPVSLLDELGVRVTPEELLDALAPAFAHWEGVLIRDGFAPVRAAWMARAARIGQPVTARFGTHELTGIFETVDAEGQLVLSAGETRHVIAAADIHFGA
ncbi:biotin--[acetyl-CoA-carboxylase] ligase [Oceanicola sp. S124]|uniref:biotin--[acetyl-CoA-carboxylase] ligase n=1 Tax=Oceanicola sp. S124 TaxID=1042378 RepID=UPI00025596F9|nr:biotin--[acetyl-CoA-carboxylase] ligase [Oceanicola sp. S124]